MNITAIDHMVMTVQDLQKTIDFYTHILGMQEITFGAGRKALLFGQQKINLHQKGNEILPNARHAEVGTIDICLLTSTPLEQVLQELAKQNVNVEEGIVERTGAVGAIRSIYLRDPDGNLIEISQYDE